LVTRRRLFEALVETALNHGARTGARSPTIALDNSPGDKTFLDFAAGRSDFLNLIDAVKETKSSASELLGPWKNLHSFSIFNTLPWKNSIPA